MNIQDLTHDQIADVRQRCCESGDCKGLRTLDGDWDCWQTCEGFQQEAEQMQAEGFWGEPTQCTCGNPEMGFDCVCDFVRVNPGDREFSCEFCGLYTASRPRCNKCSEVTT